MKKLILMTVIASVFLSCNEATDIVKDYATISVKRIDQYNGNIHKIEVEPSENAIAYEYAVGDFSELKKFEDGTLADITMVDNNIKDTLEVESADFEQILFARAIDADGQAGPVSTLRLSVFSDQLSASVYWVTDKSAAVEVFMGSNYYMFRYHMGTAQDREAFLNDEIGSNSDEDIPHFFVNTFDLEPETEYIFYLRAIDRTGKYTELYEVPVKTLSTEESPTCAFEIIHQDAYVSKVKFTPGPNCGKIAGFIDEKDIRNTELFSGLHWAGDLLKAIDGWSNLGSFEYGFASYDASPMSVEKVNKTYSLGMEMESYIVMYDKEMNPCGVYRFYFTTPEFNKDLEVPATPEIKMELATSKGGLFTIVPDKNTMGVLYGSIDADWYDSSNDSMISQYGKFYLHESLLNNVATGASFFTYGNSQFQYTESAASPSYRYYAVAAAMNANGPGNETDGRGWSEMAMLEYTTTAE